MRRGGGKPPHGPRGGGGFDRGDEVGGQRFLATAPGGFGRHPRGDAQRQALR